MGKALFSSIVYLFATGVLWAGETVAVGPTAPYERFIVFQTLAIFWAGIIGLVIIIRMKLKEIERTRRMGLDKEENNIPVLD